MKKGLLLLTLFLFMSSINVIAQQKQTAYEKKMESITIKYANLARDSYMKLLNNVYVPKFNSNNIDLIKFCNRGDF